MAYSCCKAPVFLATDSYFKSPGKLSRSMPLASTSRMLLPSNLFLSSSSRSSRLLPPRSRRKPLTVVQARSGGSVDAVDRLVSAVSYFLPLFDGIQYGRYLFLQFPAAEHAIEPLFPLLRLYKSFPYASFVAFFALYLTVVKNQSFSRYVRFNAMQAVVLDVLTIVPSLVERTFGPARGFSLTLMVSFYNTVFLFLLASFAFGVVSCVLGRTARLPLVADAADAQLF